MNPDTPTTPSSPSRGSASTARTDGANNNPRPVDGISNPSNPGQQRPALDSNGQINPTPNLPPAPPPPPGTPISPSPTQPPTPSAGVGPISTPVTEENRVVATEILQPVQPPPSPEEAAELRESSKPTLFSKIQKGLKSIVTVLALSLVVLGGAALLNAFVFQSYYVDGSSMEPALHNNDRLIISKVERTAAGVSGNPYIPKRGQVVVLDESSNRFTLAQNEQLIKRVIGLPGDTVKIDNGVVTITNRESPNGFNPDDTLELTVDPTFVEAPLEVTVPEGQIFVMGDNRTEGGSYDSRAFGPVETSHVLGRLWLRILPLNQMDVF